ncbi:MAG: hypothetical protein U0163_11815 [Gemmatimonadaceae bacterium]
MAPHGTGNRRGIRADARLVFASDRSGHGDIYRLQLKGDAPAGTPERLTSSDEMESEPAIAGGTVYFVRGAGSQARIYRLSTDGTAERLTKANAPERWPAASPTGDRTAYVQPGESGRRVHIRWLTSDKDSVVISDRAAERVSFSPDGERLVFHSTTPRDGVRLVGGRPLHQSGQHETRRPDLEC